MLGAMVRREFLGWDRVFLERAATWLLGHREELPHWLVVTPTSQSGRRLREAMAEACGAVLVPRMSTPGALLKTDDPAVAPDWMERLAWLETLEQIDDWSPYRELFPEAPEPGGDWADGFSGELCGLRASLHENGLTLAKAARLLTHSIEAGRWDALAALESLVERRLRAWGKTSRSRALADRFSLPAGISRIVLAGVTELPPLLERALLAWDGEVTVLIGAPECEAASFSETGSPLAVWTERLLPWPDAPWGSVRLVADPRQQAEEALTAVSRAKSSSDQVALGTADAETGEALAGVFTRAGWTAFHPGAPTVRTGLRRWFKAWSAWLADPKLSALADLLAMPETGALVGGRRAEKSERLSKLRDDWMAVRADDIRQRLAHGDTLSDSRRALADECLRFIEPLEKWRSGLLHGDFTATMDRLLDALGRDGRAETRDEAAAIRGWLHEAAPLIGKLRRGAGFWTGLMLEALPPPAPRPPENRVIDVQGWLELLYEPGLHLVLCGLNEGKVPDTNAADPWLGEAACRKLGLTGGADRAARDAFLYQAMITARRDPGRVDLICAKTGSGGETLLPSRLLLAAAPDDLPERVKFLFREVEPPESGLRWHADWQWRPRCAGIGGRLPVTSLAAWLACPFRFYLKHGLGMQGPEPDRVEWNARDFGTAAHEIMERWGRDEEARGFSKAEAIHGWLSNELDKLVAERFGNHAPLAVRIQTESLRQRLLWLAREQALARGEGWEIIEVERKFEIPAGGSVIVAKIDRIDRHRDTGELRVLDYKTGKVDGVDKSHRRRITARTTLPAHAGMETPAVFSGTEKGKPADFRWVNLQLPLYAAAVETRDGLLPRPCYFTLGATEADVAIHEWTDFSAADLAAARACAEWIVARIEAHVFWPPAEKVTYDDFAILTAGRPMDESFLPAETLPAD